MAHGQFHARLDAAQFLGSMKVLPFESIYRRDFAVIEQRQGNLTLFPHTEQLPQLLRAINLDFTTHLPARVARVDHRADGFMKMVRSNAVSVYTSSVNGARRDRLRLFPVLDHDLVARVAIVQQITEHSELGRAHHFRFYAGEDLFPEIYLSGKRIVFAEHVLQRFSSRVPNHVGADLSVLLRDGSADAPPGAPDRKRDDDARRKWSGR